VEAKEAIRKRKCVKKFMNKPVSMKIIYDVLDCGRWAQTALGAQSWEFIIVNGKAAKAKLAEAAGQEWLAEAPTVIVVCSNFERVEFTLKQEAHDYSIMEVSAAVQNIQVAARSLGMGTCAVFMFDRRKAQEVVKAPKKVLPIAMVPIGYSKEFPENERAPLSEFLHEEEFGRAPEEQVPDKYNKKWQRNPLIHLLS
jgi:nitroreductase